MQHHKLLPQQCMMLHATCNFFCNMLFLNVAKKITCCMQHHTLLRQEFFLLTKHPMPRARIGRPGASISVSKIEGQCLSGFGAQGWKLDM